VQFLIYNSEGVLFVHSAGRRSLLFDVSQGLLVLIIKLLEMNRSFVGLILDESKDLLESQFFFDNST